jgi:hypothetical protein
VSHLNQYSSWSEEAVKLQSLHYCVGIIIRLRCSWSYVDVVLESTAAVHTDGDSVILEYSGEIFAGNTWGFAWRHNGRAAPSRRAGKNNIEVNPFGLEAISPLQAFVPEIADTHGVPVKCGARKGSRPCQCHASRSNCAP